MSSVINTNVKALTAQGSLNAVNSKMSQAMQRLSTGLRINSSKDDAAGLAITNKMTSDIRGLAVAIRNANDGLSLAQTAEGAISSINGMLQRMRELAVQSANGTSSELARKGSQLEIEELKQEINNIAARTSFNGIRLLDGSAANLVLQTGSEVGQTMNLRLDSVSTSKLGVGARPSLSSAGLENTDSVDTSTDVFGDPDDVNSAVLRAGDLIINGTTIGSSLDTSDNLSFVGKAASAIAKSAAINEVSAKTNVKAVVNETFKAGSVMDAAADDGTIYINGVGVAVVTTSDPGVSRSNVVLAINAVSAQTGVTAVDTGSDTNGVVLKASDGRNITVAFDNDWGNIADVEKQTGLRAGTVSASYSLQSLDGNPIVVSSSESGNIEHAGLAKGTYAANTSIATTTARQAYDGTDGAPLTLTAGTLKINGFSIAGADPASDKASDTTSGAASASRSASAIAIAAAINKSYEQTGVKAVVNANVIVGSAWDAHDLSENIAAGALVSGKIWLNGVEIDLESMTGAQTRQEFADLVNSYSGQTGVVATDNGIGITYTAADGRNISMSTNLDADPANDGVDALSWIGLGTDGPVTADMTTTDGSDATTTYSKISLISDKQFTVTAGSEGAGDDLNGDTLAFTKLGFVQGTFGGESNGFKVSEVDISSQSGATAALTAIDAALDSVNFTQSRLGALQNRLDTSISNLTEVSRNTSESRSRILDADYATETTNLAKAQIVQQAATAMLAQANQSAQSVLSLLK